MVLLFSTTCHEAAHALLLSEDAAARFQAFGMQMRSFSMIGLLVAWRVFDPVFDSIFGLSLKVSRVSPCCRWIIQDSRKV